MSNIDSDYSKLDSYFVNDFNISYELKTKKIFKSILFTGLVNNILMRNMFLTDIIIIMKIIGLILLFLQQLKELDITHKQQLISY